MLGPSANPVMVFVVIAVYFVGSGYLCYLFGKKDSHTGKGTSSGM